ncbi:MAG: ABC transporter ATP-binding protein [Propionibacteriaceae bacterium]|nr:ABC transporter ATP-binding protein [Propionibacteriaceae bacterium]
MASRTPVLTATGISKAFGGVTIVGDFSLTVYPGDAVALTGRNGAGKSTILRMLIGAQKPDTGRVEFEGLRMSETNPQIRRGMASVIDDLDFFPDLSVVEHLDLMARAHGVPDSDEHVDAVLHEVQLVPQSGQLPGTLSSGQRRRLALATAFVRPRRLLVLDEPEQRLDVEGVAWLADRLVAERKRGLAIVMASHEPHLVDAVATRTIRVVGPEPAAVGAGAEAGASAEGEQ